MKAGAESDGSGDEVTTEPSQTVSEPTPRRREIVTRGAKLAHSSAIAPPAR